MTQKIIEASDQTWNEIISDKKKPVMTMFYIESCPHCQKMKPVFEALADQYSSQITFVRINAMTYLDITQKYNIYAAPAFKFFKNGQLLNKEDKTFNTEQLTQIASDLATGKL